LVLTAPQRISLSDACSRRACWAIYAKYLSLALVRCSA
jgi:hypothetical protein